MSLKKYNKAFINYITKYKKTAGKSKKSKKMICKNCNPNRKCIHNKVKYRCKYVSSHLLCYHNIFKYKCKYCKTFKLSINKTDINNLKCTHYIYKYDCIFLLYFLLYFFLYF
jgi:hypothetical protein